MAQTAVDWLFTTLDNMLELYPSEWEKVSKAVEQAKAIERDNIMKAFSDGQETPISSPTLPHYSSNEYYNEKYLFNKTDK
jgi:hypothetical protein